MILAVYVDVLNLNKVSTLKPNIASNQFEKDLSVLTSKHVQNNFTIQILASGKLLLPFQS